MNRIVLALALLLAASGAHGHDLWLERCDGGYLLLNGHIGNGDSDRETVEYLFSDIVSIRSFDVDGRATEVEIRREVPVRIEGDFAALHVVKSPEYWSETPFEMKNLPKDRAGTVIRTWLSKESTRRIDRWGDGLASPLTEGLEIIPLKDPLTLSSGKKVRLLVTMDGKPAAGVPVAYFDRTRGVTDSKGHINIRLANGGMQVIKASLTLPGDGVKADEVVHTTALVFDIEE